MTNLIPPGRQVLTLALPIPLDGLELVGELVERLYGSGDTLIDLSRGDSLAVYAPPGGFGPRSAYDAEDGKLARTVVDGDRLELTFEEPVATVLAIAEQLRAWFEQHDGINYVTCRLVTADGVETGHHVTVQRVDGNSPHDNFVAAAAERDELASTLAQLREWRDAYADKLPNPARAKLSSLLATRTEGAGDGCER